MQTWERLGHTEYAETVKHDPTIFFFNGVDDCFSSTLLNKPVKHLKASPHTWRCPYPLRCRAMLRLFDLRSSAAHAVRSPALCSQTCRWDGPERSHPRSRSPEDERRVWTREVFSCSFGYSSKSYYFVCVQAELFHHGQRLSSKRLVDLKQIDLVQLPTCFFQLINTVKTLKMCSVFLHFIPVRVLTAALMAGIGPVPMTAGSRPAWAEDTTRARGFKPRLSASDWLMSTTAAAPSLIPEVQK